MSFYIFTLTIPILCIICIVIVKTHKKCILYRKINVMGIQYPSVHSLEGNLCGVILVLKSVFNMLVGNGSPRGCLRCLMFSL